MELAKKTRSTTNERTKKKILRRRVIFVVGDSITAGKRQTLEKVRTWDANDYNITQYDSSFNFKLSSVYSHMKLKFFTVMLDVNYMYLKLRNPEVDQLVSVFHRIVAKVDPLIWRLTMFTANIQVSQNWPAVWNASKAHLDLERLDWSWISLQLLMAALWLPCTRGEDNGNSRVDVSCVGSLWQPRVCLPTVNTIPYILGRSCRVVRAGSSYSVLL
jgi:hypothetical protein